MVDKSECDFWNIKLHLRNGVRAFTRYHHTQGLHRSTSVITVQCHLVFLGLVMLCVVPGILLLIPALCTTCELVQSECWSDAVLCYLSIFRMLFNVGPSILQYFCFCTVSAPRSKQFPDILSLNGI